jgi:hypothetical protein
LPDVPGVAEIGQLRIVDVIRILIGRDERFGDPESISTVMNPSAPMLSVYE